ncbi:uncharacterized protein LOC131207212 [Anopheles bellator]|uniref:uncharacterized protein LOC131207212 n=1 Tax=Anopheles bellator TaxID=139047 RepID=UPI0026476BF9|nr:uncharacterized protein LOC131207212 [Anopheles bellator]
MFGFESGRISAMFSRKKLTAAKTRHLADQLKTCCGIFLDPTIRSPNIQQDRAQKILRTLVRRSRRDIIQHIPERDAILECSLVLVQNYVAHLRLRPRALWHCRRKPAFAEAKSLFQAIINQLIPEQQDEVIDIILRFLQHENLWKVEFICVEILLFVLEGRSPSALLLSKLIDQVEQYLARADVDQVRHVLSVLQSIIEPRHWDMMDYSDLAKLLRFYHSSVVIGTSRNQIYELRRGFETCLKNLTSLLSVTDLGSFFIMILPLHLDTDMSDEARIEFSSIVEYAASKMSLCDPRCTTNGSFVIDYLLSHVVGPDVTKSIQAAKVLTKLLESGHNLTQFQSPQIFHIETYYDIVLGTGCERLRQLLIDARPQWEHALLAAIQRHSLRKTNLEVFYQLLCVLLVEAPGGFTASAVCCLLLKVQKAFLSPPEGDGAGDSYRQQQEQIDHGRRVHGTVMAVMTLINWIHRTGSMNAYINRILHARYDDTPFLNPPLRERYQCAPHHVCWYEPGLFFDTLEIRYGLWKCFRIAEEKIPKPPARMLAGGATGGRRGRLPCTLKKFAGT